MGEIKIVTPEITQEKFSGAKFFSGFANWGKILFLLVIFSFFTIMKDSLAPAIKDQLNVKKIDTYIEAPKEKPTKFFGIKIHHFGLGFVWQ
jgi:hypothetical protein